MGIKPYGGMLTAYAKVKAKREARERAEVKLPTVPLVRK